MNVFEEFPTKVSCHFLDLSDQFACVGFLLVLAPSVTGGSGPDRSLKSSVTISLTDSRSASRAS